jgi:cation transport ATPase
VKVTASAEAPSRPRRNLGLLAAALVAWATIVAKTLLPPVLLVLTQSGAPYAANVLGQLPVMLMLLALYGLPLAVVVTFLFGWPMWWIAEERGLRTRRHGMSLGAIAGVAIAFVSLALQFATLGNTASRGDSFGNSVQDGQFTLYGWLLVFVDSLVIVGAAMLAGYTAWRVSGVEKHSL